MAVVFPYLYQVIQPSLTPSCNPLYSRVGTGPTHLLMPCPQSERVVCLYAGTGVEGRHLRRRSGWPRPSRQAPGKSLGH